MPTILVSPAEVRNVRVYLRVGGQEHHSVQPGKEVKIEARLVHSHHRPSQMHVAADGIEYELGIPEPYLFSSRTFHGRIQLLLPLFLRNPKKPDLALTLERYGGMV
jgi:hypothetical protein